MQSLQMMDLEWLPESFRVSTPSGGMHVYIDAGRDTPVSNRVNNLPNYPGLDIRGDQGYVLGAGSTLPEGRYEIAKTGVIASAPVEFLDLLIEDAKRKLSHKPAPTRDPICKLDQPENVERAIHYLVHQAAEAVEGAGGDRVTYEVACRMRDFGLSEDQAWWLMCEHWNETKASPPWDSEELQTKVGNAYCYAKGGWGHATAAADFDDLGDYDIGEPPSKQAIEAAQAPAKPKSRLYALSIMEAAERALQARSKPLIEGFLDQGALAVFYGESGIGKTFALMDMLFSVSTGRRWAKRTTARGLVVYLAAEGGTGVFGRLKALLVNREFDDDPLFSLVPCGADLFGASGDTAELIQLINAEREKFDGAQVHAVAVDTLARTMGAGDENSNRDMGQYIENAVRIREKTGAAVILVHHTGKDKLRGARGASALRAATDSEFEVRRDGNARAAINTTKQRDMDEAAPVRFRLSTVSIGTTDDGRELQSCVPVYDDDADVLRSMELTTEEEALFEALLDLAADNEGRSVAGREWRDAYRRRLDPNWTEEEPAPRGGSERHVRNLQNALMDFGKVQRTTNGWWRVCE